MAKATYVKEILGPTGKKKYQATVWHKGVFYGSMVCDSKKLAVEFKEAERIKAAQGGPSNARRAKASPDPWVSGPTST